MSEEEKTHPAGRRLTILPDRAKIPCEVNHILSSTERLVVGDEIAQHVQGIERLERAKDTFIRQHKADVEKHQNDIKAKSLILTNGYETRVVECIQAADYAKKRVVYLEPEGMRPVGFRPMTEEERTQPVLLTNDIWASEFDFPNGY